MSASAGYSRDETVTQRHRLDEWGLREGTITTGMLECSTSSRLVLPRRQPECSPDPRVPTTIKSTEYGSSFIRSNAELGSPSITSHSTADGSIPASMVIPSNHVLMWSDLPGNPHAPRGPQREPPLAKHGYLLQDWRPSEERPGSQPEPSKPTAILCNCVHRWTPLLKAGYCQNVGRSPRTRQPLAPAPHTWEARDLPLRRAERPKRRPSTNAVHGRCTRLPGTTPDVPGKEQMNSPAERAAQNPPLRGRAHREDRPDGHRSHTTPGPNPAQSDRSPGERSARKRVRTTSPVAPRGSGMLTVRPMASGPPTSSAFPVPGTGATDGLRRKEPGGHPKRLTGFHSRDGRPSQ